MRRLLLSLYVVLVATVIGSVFAIVWLWDHGLRTELVRGGEYAALSAQFLFENELRDTPVAKWPDRIEQLKAQFGYEVTLLTLPEVQASERNLDRLRHGLPALDESNDEIKYMLLPLRGRRTSCASTCCNNFRKTRSAVPRASTT